LPEIGIFVYRKSVAWAKVFGEISAAQRKKSLNKGYRQNDKKRPPRKKMSNLERPLHYTCKRYRNALGRKRGSEPN